MPAQAHLWHAEDPVDENERVRKRYDTLNVSFLRFLSSHRDDFDVIHCHAFTFLSASCVPIARTLRKPILVKVATEQDIREFRYGKNLMFRIFRPMLWRSRTVASAMRFSPTTRAGSRTT